jgi:heme oxygenase (biliverdin-IX-beta and delta-forming)
MTIEGTQIERQPSSQRPSRRDILSRLKLETAAEHAAIEGATRVMSPELSTAEYRRYLEDTFGFYKVVEAQLSEAGVWDALGLSSAERVKLPLLVRDLEQLGAGDTSKLDVCAAPPVFASVADAVGGAYVLEGSTLGGRVISRHLQQRFGAAVPRAFLECYGARTGENWQAFRTALGRFADCRETDERVLRGAKATFRAFTRWLER